MFGEFLVNDTTAPVDTSRASRAREALVAALEALTVEEIGRLAASQRERAADAEAAGDPSFAQGCIRVAEIFDEIARERRVAA